MEMNRILLKIFPVKHWCDWAFVAAVCVDVGLVLFFFTKWLIFYLLSKSSNKCNQVTITCTWLDFVLKSFSFITVQSQLQKEMTGRSHVQPLSDKLAV